MENNNKLCNERSSVFFFFFSIKAARIALFVSRRLRNPCKRLGGTGGWYDNNNNIIIVDKIIYFYRLYPHNCMRLPHLYGHYHL